MDQVLVVFFVPVIIFLVIVAPIWLFLHYRSKSRAQGQLSEAEREDLDQLTAQAQQMIERIETLEAILDAEAPGWRKRPSDGFELHEEPRHERQARSAQ